MDPTHAYNAPSQGDILEGRFELLAPLGRGGAGDVWRVLDRWVGQERALKVLREAPARVPDEALLLAELRHPGLACLHDYVPGPPPAFTMDLIEGADLSAGSALPLHALARIARDTLEALAFLHGRGWLHRDIKPANIRVTSDGRGVLLDLGLAALQGVTSLAGTPAWLAPELRAGATQTVQSDLFGLGASLRDAADPAAQKTLATWFRRLTATAPEARMTSARIALRELRALVTDLPAPAVLASPRILGRDRELAAITAALAALRDTPDATPRMIIIEGVEGSGRTRLQTTARQRAQLLGIPAFDLSIQHATDDVTGVDDPITASEIAAARVRASERRIDSMRNAKSDRLVLCIDADDPDQQGLPLLRHIMSTARSGVLVIARARRGDDAISNLARENDEHTVRLSLEGLAPAALADLVRDLTALPNESDGAEEVAATISARASTLPGPFLTSLQTLGATGGLVATDERATLLTHEIPVGVDVSTIQALLGTLATESRHALTCLIGFGAPLGPGIRNALGCNDVAMDALVRKSIARRFQRGARVFIEPAIASDPSHVVVTSEQLGVFAAVAEAHADEIGPAAEGLAAWQRLRGTPTTDHLEHAVSMSGVALRAGQIASARRLLNAAAHTRSMRSDMAIDDPGPNGARRRAAMQLARVNACLGDAGGARDAVTLATKLASNDGERALSLSAQGETERLLGSIPEAAEALDQALCGAHLQDDDRARALRIRAICRLQLGKTDEAIDDAEVAVTTARGAREKATALGTRAQVFHRAGRDAEALADVDTALARTRDDSLSGTLPAGLRQLRGVIRAALGEPAQAIEDLEAAADAFRRAGHLINLANTLNNVALLQERTGSLERALSTHTEAGDIRSRSGDAIGIATTHVNRGALGVRLGHWSAARRDLKTAVSSFHQLQHPRAEVSALIALAELELELGRPEDAQQRASAAQVLAADSAFPDEVAAASLVLADTLDPRTDSQRIEALLAHDAGHLRPTRALAILARTEAANGNLKRAERHAIAATETAACPEDQLLATGARAIAGLSEPSDAAALRDLLPTLASPAHRVEAALLAAEIAFERADGPRLAAAIEHALQDLTPEEGHRMYTTRWDPRVESTLSELRGDGGAIAGESMAALQRVSRMAASARKPSDILAELLDACIELGQAEHGFIVLRTGDAFECVVARQQGGRTVEVPDRMLSSTIIHDVLAHGRPITTGNARDDSRFGSMLSVNNLKLTSVACLPFTAEGRVLGAIYLDHPGREDLFSENRIDLLSAFANHAALVFQRSEREEQIRTLNQRLKELLQHEKKRTRAVTAELRAVAGASEDRIIAESPGMREVLDFVDRVAPADIPVLIVGETGTGKDLIAREIHERSARHESTFLSENCAAIPAPLLEAELFGAKRGAYTGAVNDRAGLMSLASGGTLFLDEVGDMPQELQSKLLRALEDGSVRPLGSNERVKTDFRLVTATNRPAKDLQSGNQFRPDLFYRIGAAVITIPPLRERPEDAAAFINRFLAARRDQPLRLEAAARQILLSYDWPGNFRELQNEMARLSALADGPNIGESLLSDRIRQFRAPSTEAIPYDLRELRRWALQRALEASRGRKDEAARRLGVSRSTLYQELKKHELSSYLRPYNRRHDAPDQPPHDSLVD